MPTPDELKGLLTPGGALESYALIHRHWSAGLIGRRVGSYRIEQKIGEGGMGHVYLGRRDDGAFDRTVAIKVAFGAVLNAASRQRYYRERDILATLDHPHIAHLYDAGVAEEGWPYLIMEYVAGEPIDDYCAGRGLSIGDRLHILSALVEAVAYAHAHLVVHQDIKPSNVLVGEDGRPKLLDFGIAGMLGPEGVEQTATRPMTPRFASPEQLLGRPITIASDIYQLGLLFHRVLTGRDLVADLSLEEVARRAIAGSPQRVDRDLRARVPRDVITIMEHCFEIEVARRYRDANALHDDLQRYQTGYPLAVAPNRRNARMRKFVARNKAATAIVTLMTVGTILSTTYYTTELARSRVAAEARAETVTRVLETVTALLGDTYESMMRATGGLAREQSTEVLQNEPLRAILSRTDALIEEMLHEEHYARAELLLLQGRTNRVLSRLDVATSQLEAARAAARQEDRGDLELRVLTERIIVAHQQRDAQDAERYADVLLDHPALGSAPAEIRAAAYDAVAQAFELRGEYDLALAHMEQAVSLFEEAEPGGSRRLARAYTQLGDVYSLLEQSDAAMPWHERAIDMMVAMEGDLYRGLAVPYGALGWAYQAKGDHQTAYAYYQKSLDIALANEGPISLGAAAGHNNVAMALKNLGRYDEALAHYQSAMTSSEQLGEVGHRGMAMLYLNMGNLYADLGQMTPASEHYREGLSVAARMGPSGRRGEALLLNNYGHHLLDLGNLDAAIDLLRRARKAKSTLFGEDNVSTARTTLVLARALIRAGELAEARTLIDEAALAHRAAYRENPMKLGLLLETTALWQERTGDLAAARETFEEALSARREEFGAAGQATGRVALALARLSLAEGQDPSPWLSRAAPALAELPAEHLLVIEARLIQTAAGRLHGAANEPTGMDICAVIEHRYPARADLLARCRPS